MSINMPHEGGLNVLRIVFGTEAKEVNSFCMWLYTASPTFTDSDVLSTTTGIIDAADWYTAPGTGDISSLTNHYYTAAQLATTGIITVPDQTGIPTVQFPEFIATFATIPTGVTDIYGYALTALTANVILFREPFVDPWPIAANSTLRFTPSFQLGNTTGVLT
jgi:hypothetical protein